MDEKHPKLAKCRKAVLWDPRDPEGSTLDAPRVTNTRQLFKLMKHPKHLSCTHQLPHRIWDFLVYVC